MKEVVLDSSALMIPGSMKIDIFSQLRELGFSKFLVPQEVVEELKSLRGRRIRSKGAAGVGLQLLMMCEVVDRKVGKADDAVLQLALERNAYLFTGDRELRRRAREKGIRLLTLRGRVIE